MKHIVLSSITGFIAWLIVSFLLVRGDGAPVPAPASASAPPAHSASATLAKDWTRTWGGNSDDNASRVAVDGAGNVYVAGEFTGTVDFDPDPAITDTHTSVSGSIDAFLSKFDSSGRFLWARTWGGIGRDVAYGVGVDGSGNAYVVGPFRHTVDFNPDPVLTEMHTSNAITQTYSENNVYLSKFAPDGTFQFVRTWGPALVPGRASLGAEAYAVAVHGDDLYVVGDFSGDQTDFNPWGSHDWHQNHVPSTGPIFFDAFLSKFDTSGNFQWAKTWGGEGYDDGPGVTVDGSGNVYVAGMYASQTINFDPAGGVEGMGHPASDSGIMVDVFLSKFDASGNFQWVRTWGGQGAEDAMGLVAVDGADGVYVAGRFASLNCDFNPEGTPDVHSTNGSLDVFVSKFNSDGTFQWATTWGGSGSDNAMGLAVDGPGHVYVSGWFSDTVDFNPRSGIDNHVSNGLRDAFLSRLDSAGNFDWAETWGASGEDMGGVGLDGSGHVYVAGRFTGAVDFDPGSGFDSHTSKGGSDAFVTRFLRTAMQISPTTLAHMAEPADPPRTFTLHVASSSAVTFTWTATFTPTLSAWVSASPLSGQSGATLTVVITPMATVGSVQTNLQIVTSDPWVENDNQTIHLRLDVVSQVHAAWLPLIQRSAPLRFDRYFGGN